MKKTIKRISITLITLFALLGAGATAAYANGYINWKGTPEYNQTKENLLQVSTRITKMKTDRDVYKQKVKDTEQIVKDTEQQVKDKEQQIKDKEQLVKDKVKEIEEKNKEIAELKKNQASKAELNQAYEDMKDLKGLSEELLNDMEE